MSEKTLFANSRQKSIDWRCSWRVGSTNRILSLRSFTLLLSSCFLHRRDYYFVFSLQISSYFFIQSVSSLSKDLIRIIYLMEVNRWLQKIGSKKRTQLDTRPSTLYKTYWVCIIDLLNTRPVIPLSIDGLSWLDKLQSIRLSRAIFTKIGEYIVENQVKVIF